MRVIFLIIFIVLGLVGIYSFNQSKTDITFNNPITPTVTVNPNQIEIPIDDFKSRITKKTFGIYVTPQKSPVDPEKFTGYHAGVDVEYEDTETEVPVKSITDGVVVYSAWTKGYGGLTVIKSQINNQPITTLYGHLNPNNLPDVSTQIKKGDRIGVLGKGYTSETDNERRHLHLAIHKGDNLVLLGYIQNKADLKNWIDPLTLY